jgi:hypothetical protein
MQTLAVRVTKPDHALLQEMAQREGKPMGAVLSEAIRRLRTARLLEATNEAYAALRKDPKAWAEVEAERSEWDSVLSDGMGDA